MTGGCACAKSAGEQAPCACSATAQRKGQLRKLAGPAAQPPSHTIGLVAPPSVAATLAFPGEPLDAVLRAGFESRFGASLRDVRVHADGSAARSAADVGARAYTVSNHVVFANGFYAPSTDEGRRLIAHELVHVLQQRPGAVPSATALRIDDSGEAAAVRGAQAPSRSITRSLVGRAPAVQRQPAPTAPAASPAKALDKTKEGDALNFYLSWPNKYTPQIMRQVQARLSVPQTGVADSATVQAVAAFQQTQSAGPNPLLVDGKAAARTLARLFPSGLNVPGEAESYGKEVQAGVIDQWTKLTADQRAQELIKLVNPHLIKAGIPPVAASTTSAPKGAKGAFDSSAWAVELDPATLADAGPTAGKAADLGETIYHEARHAEQTFRAAQMRSLALRKARTSGEDDRLAQAISTELRIKLDVAKVAAKNDQSLSKMDRLIAQDWYHEEGPAKRDTATVEAVAGAAKNDCLAAKAKNEANPTPQNQAALDQAAAEWVIARDDYHQLAIENDAFATEKRVAPGITRGVTEGPDPLDPCGTPHDP